MCEPISDIPTDLGYGDVQPDGSVDGWTGEDGSDPMAHHGQTMEEIYAEDSDSLPDGGEHDRNRAVTREQGGAGEPQADVAAAPPTPTDPAAPTAAQYEAAADQQEHLTESEDLQKLQQDMQQTSETAQMLSNIAGVRHQTMMGIINNMR